MKLPDLLKNALGALVILVVFTGGATAELAKPTGPVVLTIGGAVKYTNRAPFDAFDDAFLNTHE